MPDHSLDSRTFVGSSLWAEAALNLKLQVVVPHSSSVLDANHADGKRAEKEKNKQKKNVVPIRPVSPEVRCSGAQRLVQYLDPDSR